MTSSIDACDGARRDAKDGRESSALSLHVHGLMRNASSFSRRGAHRRLVSALALTLVGCSPVAAPPRATAGGGAATLPPIHHVWVIEMENKSYDDTFAGPQTFLGRTLPGQGALLRQYFGIGHVSTDNYIAEISGQAPNPLTQGDCVRYSDFQGSSQLDSDGQVTGQGCVYPSSVHTLADQLEAAQLTWKAYMEDMGNDPNRESATCGHPDLGSTDNTQHAAADDQYATRHDPFVYFHSIIDNADRCQSHVVALDALGHDLRSVDTTPSFSFITPNLCNDGHDDRCVGTNLSGSHVGGAPAMDGWLQKYVPLITASPAYQHDGLVIVTFDEADTDATEACCQEPTGPNTDAPGGNGPGGGRVGTILLSRFIRPGTLSDVPYNHYSLLRSLEDLFGIRTGGADGHGHLGFAGQAELRPFGADIFTKPSG